MVKINKPDVCNEKIEFQFYRISYNIYEAIGIISRNIKIMSFNTFKKYKFQSYAFSVIGI